MKSAPGLDSDAERVTFLFVFGQQLRSMAEHSPERLRKLRQRQR